MMYLIFINGELIAHKSTEKTAVTVLGYKSAAGLTNLIKTYKADFKRNINGFVVECVPITHNDAYKIREKHNFKSTK